jgi:hypothetical protein
MVKSIREEVDLKDALDADVREVLRAGSKYVAEVNDAV